MDALLDWLVRAGVISKGVRQRLGDKASKLLDELKSGIVLARLAAKLDYAGAAEIEATPTMQIQREKNYKIFAKACKVRKIGVLFTFQELQRKDNFEGIVKTLENVAKRLEATKNIASFRQQPRLMQELSRSEPIDYNIYSCAYDELLSGGVGVGSAGDDAADADLVGGFAAGGGGDGECSDDSFSNDYYVTYIVGSSHKSLQRAEAETEAGKSRLESAIEEVYEVEERYFGKLSLYKGAQKYTEDTLLRGFFVDIQPLISELLEFHSSLYDQLKSCQPEFFGDIFMRSKLSFLKYSHFIDKCKNIKSYIKKHRAESTLMTEQLRFHQISSGGDSVQAAAAADAGGGPGSERPGIRFASRGEKTINLDELLTIPMQHVLHYRLLLENILHRAHKMLQEANPSTPAWTESFSEGVTGAIEAMKDVNTFINTYIRDSEYMASIRGQISRIRNMDDKGRANLITQHGLLKFDGKFPVRLGQDKKYKWRYLCCFQALVLICGIDEVDGEEILTAKKFIKVDSLRHVSQERDKRVLKVLSLDSNNVEVESDNFYLRCDSLRSLEEMELKFKELTTIKLSEGHTGVAHLRRSDDIRVYKCPRTCDSCQKLLYGRLVIGLTCSCCQKIYHESCYSKGFYEHIDIYEDKIEQLRTKRKQMLEEMQSISEEGGNEEATSGTMNDFTTITLGRPADKKTLLHSKTLALGTFVVYMDPESRHYRLAVRAKKQEPEAAAAAAATTPRDADAEAANAAGPLVKVKKYKIEEQMLDDGSVQLVVEKHRTFFPTIEQLVNFYRQDLLLLYNYADVAKDEAGEDNEDETLFGEQEEAIPDEENTEVKDSIQNNGDNVWNEFEEAHIWSHCPDAFSLLEDCPNGAFIVVSTDNPERPYTIFARQQDLDTVRRYRVSQGMDDEGQTYLELDGASYLDLRELVAKNRDWLVRPVLPSQGAPAPKTPQVLRGKPSPKPPLKAKPTLPSASIRPVVRSRPSVRRRSTHAGRPPTGKIKHSLQELSTLHYFVGVKTSREAQKLLSKKPTGTFLLRLNMDGQYRITMKKKQVGHQDTINIEIVEEGDGYHIGSSTFAHSIVELVNILRDPGKKYYLEHEYKK